MKMFTRPELRSLREALRRDPSLLGTQPDLVARLLDQAEHGLDCAALLEDAVHFPAEPYGEAEVLVARLTNGVNAIWNRFHYRGEREGAERA